MFALHASKMKMVYLYFAVLVNISNFTCLMTMGKLYRVKYHIFWESCAAMKMSQHRLLDPDGCAGGPAGFRSRSAPR